MSHLLFYLAKGKTMGASSKNFNDLTKARSVRDLTVVVDRITHGISELKNKPHQVSLKSQSNSKVHEAGDMVRKVGGSKLFDGTYEKEIKISSNINVDAEMLNRVREYVSELTTAKTLALSPEFSRLKTTKPLLKAISDATREAELIVRSQLKSMHVTAKDTVPDEHKKVSTAIRKHLEKILPKDRYTSITQTSYVVPDKTAVQKGWLQTSGQKDNVLFQSFLKIEDLVDREGYAYTLYVVLTSRLEGQRLKFYVTSLKTNRVPGTFPVGANILSPAKMRLQLNALLSVDGFVGEVDRKPVGKSSSDLRRSGLHEIDGVSGARVVNGDKIVISMKGLTPEEEKKTIIEVRTVLNSLLKTGTNSAIRHKVEKGSRAGVKLLYLTVGPTEKPSKLELTSKKAKQFADLLGLDNKKTRAFLDSAK